MTKFDGHSKKTLADGLEVPMDTQAIVRWRAYQGV